MLQRYMVWDVKGILGHNAGRNANELCVGAVVEEQIVAEIFLAASAEIALAAGGGVERDYAVAGSKARDSLAGLDDGSRQLMAKEGRRRALCEHPRVRGGPQPSSSCGRGEARSRRSSGLGGRRIRPSCGPR